MGLYFFALVLTATFAEFLETREEGILILDEENIAEAIQYYDNIVINFYTPFCGHCTKLEPIWKKLAFRVANDLPNLTVAQIDAGANPSVVQTYKLTGYPAIRIFSGKKIEEYKGQRAENDIWIWLEKQVGNPVKVISSIPEMKKFINAGKVAVVFFGVEGGREASLFTSVAREMDGNYFAMTSDRGCINEYGVKIPGLVIFKKFDDKRNDFKGVFTKKEIVSFIDKKRVPSLLPFDNEVLELIFKRKMPVLVVFRREGMHYDEEIYKGVELVKNNIVTTYADLTSEGNKRLAEYFGLTDKPMPFLFIVDPSDGDIQKYIGPSEITPQQMQTFVSQWYRHDLPAYYKSQAPPKFDVENGIRILTGNTFSEIVYDSQKDVLVEFYAPWCEHCRKFLPDFEKAAEKFSENRHLVLAKIDATANEIPEVPVKSFPLVRFFTADNKEGVDLEGDRSFDKLAEFIEQNAYHKVRKIEERAEL